MSRSPIELLEHTGCAAFNWKMLRVVTLAEMDGGYGSPLIWSEDSAGQENALDWNEPL